MAQSDSEALLGNLFLDVFAQNPETYKEYEKQHPAILVEWATWLYLLSEHPTPFGTLPSEPGYSQLFQLLAETIKKHQLTLVLKSVQGQSDPSENSSRKLRLQTQLHSLNVRNPAFEHHLRSELRSLFDPFSPELNELGLPPVEEALRVMDALERVLNGRLTEDVNKALRLVRAWNAGAQKDVQAQLGDGYAQIETAIPAFEVSRGALARLFTFAAASRAALITPRDLVCDDVDEPTSTRFLSALSMASPQVPIANSLPSVYDPLEKRPLVRVDDSAYLCHLAGKVQWALPRLYEEGLAGSAAWHRYERHRARYLEEEAVALIANLSPHSESGHSLKYSFDDGGGDEEYELDGLVRIDTTLFLVEAKAGRLSLAASRGAPSLFEDLEVLVGRAHQQGMRAERYLGSGATTRFVGEDGRTLEINSREIRRIILVNPTIDPLSSCVTRLSELAETGLLKPGRLPWSVYVHDLRMICEIVEGPGQLVHYLERRLALEKRAVQAHDEIDWFGHYLSEGLYFDNYPNDMPLHLLSYTTPFDDYYLHKIGKRQTPAPKPSQSMPQAIRGLIQRLEREGPPGFIEIVVALLQPGQNERDEFAELVENRRGRADRTGFSSFRTLYGKDLVVFAAGQPNQPLGFLERYARATKYDSEADSVTFVFEPNDGGPLSVAFIEFPWIEDMEEAKAAKEILTTLRTTLLKDPKGK